MIENTIENADLCEVADFWVVALMRLRRVGPVASLAVPEVEAGHDVLLLRQVGVARGGRVEQVLAPRARQLVREIAPVSPPPGFPCHALVPVLGKGRVGYCVMLLT